MDAINSRAYDIVNEDLSIRDEVQSIMAWKPERSSEVDKWYVMGVDAIEKCLKDRGMDRYDWDATDTLKWLKQSVDDFEMQFDRLDMWREDYIQSMRDDE